ncbi:MAG: malto-oligosyltrehalose synthase, partial [Chitinophagaceae bacterium]
LQVGEQFYPLNAGSVEEFITSPGLSVDDINKDPNKIKRIEEAQHYKLAYWEDTDSVLNFRRFFTVNALISLNIQDEQVFTTFHEKTLEYTAQGLFDGLRIDHIDGLYDPAEYLKRLREEIGPDKYLVVEKILQRDEKLPKWPVDGSTGYDFLSIVNNFFTYKKNKSVFKKKYAKFTDEYENPSEVKLDKKREILHKHMAGDLENLFRLFVTLDPGYVSTLSLQETAQLKTIIAGILVECPVYRYYPATVEDNELIESLRAILDKLEKTHPDLLNIISQVRDMFLVRSLGLDAEYNKRLLHFFRRCMQYTGPLTAKGVEDTLMYTYHPFLAHNEVGDDVEAFGIGSGKFNQLMMEKIMEAPLSMNATSTHDTKRGEDSRSRLNLLSEIPELWFAQIKNWRAINSQTLDDYHIHPNDEYFIYQALFGAYPFPGEQETGFLQRIQEYLVKALREGKSRTNWSNPDLGYEKNIHDFLSIILNKEGDFYDSFHQFLVRVADFSVINSLSQLTLKMTAPGVPDVYQGSEFWDLSLVDPDNRTAVNYLARSGTLEQIKQSFIANEKETLVNLWQERYTGHIKLFLTWILLNERKNDPGIFASGKYVPLKIKGKFRDHLFAFARVRGDNWMITVVPRFTALQHKADSALIGNVDWKNTRIIIPTAAPANMNTLFDETWKIQDGSILAGDLFKQFPVNIIRLKAGKTERSAGVLLSITSLPSKYGTGDFGPAAYTFADQLSVAQQRYWQMLPLNPVTGGSGYSPYSSYSAMGGNTLLISPELLAEQYLPGLEMPVNTFDSSDKADFALAEKFRNDLFDKAFANFNKSPGTELQEAYEEFAKRQAWWLEDHALFFVLKDHHQQQHWIHWEAPFKNRIKSALEDFSLEHANEIDKEKWLQFIFDCQFEKLKAYCANLNIRLIGDLPFYIGHDSADVWANREIFDLDESGNMIGVAGVPPDYFNEEGQLWGMPVFRWNVLAQSGYAWWINRIKRNLELVDLLRLDHFRAFAGFWKVDAGETTAIRGTWEPGPGDHLLKVLKQNFPSMPFIAEDLGEITSDVYQLRDDYSLPGMRVLQFAFGDDISISVNTPHNYTIDSVAYTGTHDNNTSKGWFRKDSSSLERKNMSNYFGVSVREKNAHRILSKAAYASVSKTVILPMQDILGLDESGRMNTPAKSGDQWLWRLLPEQFTAKQAAKLAKWVRMYNRG